MINSVLNVLENFADAINPYDGWFKFIGFLGIVLFIILVNTELRNIGFLGGVTAIWCGGLWLVAALFSRSQTAWTKEGSFPISQVRSGSGLQKVFFTIFYLIWLLGLLGISIVLLFKITS